MGGVGNGREKGKWGKGSDFLDKKNDRTGGEERTKGEKCCLFQSIEDVTFPSNIPRRSQGRALISLTSVSLRQL